MKFIKKISIKKSYPILFILIILTIVKIITNPKYYDYNCKLQFLGDVEFTIENLYLKDKFYHFDKVNPICGCRNEKLHYGLTFTCYSYSLTFYNDSSEYINPSLYLYAPNEVMLNVGGVRRKIGTNHIEYIPLGRTPFEIELEIFKVPLEDYLRILEEKNFSEKESFNEIYSRYNSTKLKNNKKGVYIKNYSEFLVLFLDDVMMTDIVPPYESKIHIHKITSNITNKVDKFLIDINLNDVGKRNFFIPKFTNIGRKNAYVFGEGEIWSSDGELLYKNISYDTVSIMVAYSGFSQKISPINNHKINKILIRGNNVISQSDYKRMIDNFNNRRDGFYTATMIEEDDKPILTIIMNPPIINKMNGIHFYGLFKDFISYKTLGKIQVNSIEEKEIIYPQKIKIIDIDTMDFATIPLIIPFNLNKNYTNDFYVKGKLMINDKLFKPNFWQSYLILKITFFTGILSLVLSMLNFGPLKKILNKNRI